MEMEEKMKKGGVGCKKGGSAVSCPQAPVENWPEMSWKVHKGLYLFYYPMDWVQIWKC